MRFFNEMRKSFHPLLKNGKLKDNVQSSAKASQKIARFIFVSSYADKPNIDVATYTMMSQ
ncbi:hypothetical protein J6TS7_61290 [Paenibacillus dendritiformis]|uniref:hypothetical protein n=1 Tax=Paenibacillus melissococcoides TaxID=2912268 RepID=UPI001B190B8E|nr:hypothetical protein [Paenibacillus melissococcoides]GIO82519.1 hypothetical protein J6TS7_61290 [Paenibacillus dendritiformis]CAH8720934.1 hypothetical protein HTL2_006116 [Paenibacillus melissococcoides]